MKYHKNGNSFLSLMKEGLFKISLRNIIAGKLKYDYQDQNCA